MKSGSIAACPAARAPSVVRKGPDLTTLAIFGPLSLEGAAAALREAEAVLRSRGSALPVGASSMNGWNRALAEILKEFESALRTALVAAALLSGRPEPTPETNRPPAGD